MLPVCREWTEGGDRVTDWKLGDQLGAAVGMEVRNGGGRRGWWSERGGGWRECCEVLGPGRVHGVVTSWSTALLTSALAVLSLHMRGSQSCAVRRGLWRLRPGGGGHAVEKSRGKGPEAGGAGHLCPGGS